MKLKILIIILVAIALIGLVAVLHASAHNDDHDITGCNANNPQNCPKPTEICDNGEHEGNPHCVSPTPTVEPSVSPTEAVTPTPECDEDKDSEFACPPTPTVTPEATVTPEVPTATPTCGPNGCGWSPKPENPSDGRGTPSVNSPYDNKPVGWK